MSCFRTPQLTEIELLMALDGEADPEVTMHLAHCPDCRARRPVAEAAARADQSTLSHRLPVFIGHWRIPSRIAACAQA